MAYISPPTNQLPTMNQQVFIYTNDTIKDYGPQATNALTPRNLRCFSSTRSLDLNYTLTLTSTLKLTSRTSLDLELDLIASIILVKQGYSSNILPCTGPTTASLPWSAGSHSVDLSPFYLPLHDLRRYWLQVPT